MFLCLSRRADSRHRQASRDKRVSPTGNRDRDVRTFASTLFFTNCPTAVEVVRYTPLHTSPVSIVTRVRRASRNFAVINGLGGAVALPPPFERIIFPREGRSDGRWFRANSATRIRVNHETVTPRGNFRSINQEETLATRCRLLHVSDAPCIRACRLQRRYSRRNLPRARGTLPDGR